MRVFSIASAGLEAQAARLDGAARSIAKPRPTGADGSKASVEPDYVGAAVTRSSASAGYRANLQVMRAADDMLGTLVNLIA
ncbi:MAG: hypothetical protein HY698_07590 [Deltaproteobacteria bacterium]|nr:hypothetical protein [Deltaproteobacteria bacterium]